jgi:hypothetical protein
MLNVRNRVFCKFSINVFIVYSYCLNCFLSFCQFSLSFRNIVLRKMKTEIEFKKNKIKVNYLLIDKNLLVLEFYF